MFRLDLYSRTPRNQSYKGGQGPIAIDVATACG